jgi:hypothetical protein
MSLTAAVDITVSPITLTVTSDRRKVTGTVVSQGETATYSATFPVTVTDTSGRVWTVKTDDGIKAVYSS